MIFSVKRDIQVVFTKEHKYVFNKDNRKEKNDYLLNVNKIKKSLFDDLPIILNKTQVFVLNFEVQKMFNKALTIANQKYTNIIYINSDLNNIILSNIITYLDKNYTRDIQFSYVLFDKLLEFDNVDINANRFKIINEL